MKHVLRRHDSDALLDGETLGTDGELDDVEAFLADMRLEFSALPAPEPRPTLAATLDGRRELRPASSGPVPKPTVPEPGPRVHYRFRPIAAMLVSGAVLFGGLATAGALPGPLQRATAEATSHLGIHLPGDTTSPPAAVPSRSDHRGSDGTSTTSGSGPDRVSGTATTTPQPSATSTTVVPPVAGAPTTPATTPTVELPPPLITTPTLPAPVPNLGTVPFFTPLPTLPGLVTPTGHLGVLHHHKVP
jgi:hypothetical protein